MSIAERLTAMGIALPAPPQPAGAYMRAKRTGNLIFVAGQLPMVSGGTRVGWVPISAWKKGMTRPEFVP